MLGGPTRVAAYSDDLRRELWALGAPVQTRRSEVAPAQSETAPAFEAMSAACDHNLLNAVALRRVGAGHDHRRRANEASPPILTAGLGASLDATARAVIAGQRTSTVPDAETHQRVARGVDRRRAPRAARARETSS